MKYIYILVAFLLLSCGNRTPKYKFVITYEFENPDNLSTNEKQGTIETLNKRLDKYVSNHEVKLNKNQQIEVKLDTKFKLDFLNTLITNPGRLDFWEVVTPEELGTFFLEANGVIEKVHDSINPLFDLMSIDDFSNGLFSVAAKDTSQFRYFINKKEVKQLVPKPLRRSKFLFGIPNENNFLPVYMVKTTPEGIGFVNESHISNVRQSVDPLNRPAIGMQMNQEGASRWERLTSRSYQNNSRIAITLNDLVYAAPAASSGPILGGNTELSGGFTKEQTQEIELVLSAFKRIPKLKFVNSSTIND